jgi:hypothetical protein
MPWHVHVVSLSAGGSRLKVKGGFTGYALRTGEICRVMSQMKTRLKGSVVLRLLWPHYFSALAAWRCAPQSAEHRGVKRKTAPGSAWGTLPGAALGLCGCVGPSYPRPCIKEIVSRLTGISRSICISRPATPAAWRYSLQSAAPHRGLQYFFRRFSQRSRRAIIPLRRDEIQQSDVLRG